MTAYSPPGPQAPPPAPAPQPGFFERLWRKDTPTTPQTSVQVSGYAPVAASTPQPAPPQLMPQPAFTQSSGSVRQPTPAPVAPPVVHAATCRETLDSDGRFGLECPDRDAHSTFKQASGRRTATDCRQQSGANRRRSPRRSRRRVLRQPLRLRLPSSPHRLSRNRPHRSRALPVWPLSGTKRRRSIRRPNPKPTRKRAPTPASNWIPTMP